MRKINSFAEAERFVGEGLEGLMSESLLSPEAAGIMSAGDEPVKEACITTYVQEGRQAAEHYVLECRTGTGASYMVCIHVGNGASIQHFNGEDWLAFREECEDYGLLLAGKPLLAYTFKGLVRVEAPTD
ncbi:hypothetical protein [Cohnella sp. 56]|uniref:hypothetical protein n=1 Tax=Cohnella sp. 56 TaxID=3113722 RepID=UPI0030E9A02C